MVATLARSQALAVIRERFQELVPRMILLHERVAKEVGLGAVELQVLHLLTLAGRPLSPSAISSVAELPRSTTARALAGLEAAGYVVRTRVADDGRRALIHAVTRQAAEVSAKFDVYARAMETAATFFADAELEVVARYWEEFERAASDPEGGPISRDGRMD